MCLGIVSLGELSMVLIEMLSENVCISEIGSLLFSCSYSSSLSPDFASLLQDLYSEQPRKLSVISYTSFAFPDFALLCRPNYCEKFSLNRWDFMHSESKWLSLIKIGYPFCFRVEVNLRYNRLLKGLVLFLLEWWGDLVKETSLWRNSHISVWIFKLAFL